MIKEKTIKENCIDMIKSTFINGLCECDLSGISVGCLIQVLEEMGYECIGNGIDHPSLETNGWEIDFWAYILPKDQDTSEYMIEGSVMYGLLKIKKNKWN